eukprot:m.209949 g.209949  ORF g.209949 m.209949 type:complete len:56 (+) comp10731_c0_seq4:155-322(+)
MLTLTTVEGMLYVVEMAKTATDTPEEDIRVCPTRLSRSWAWGLTPTPPPASCPAC